MTGSLIGDRKATPLARGLLDFFPNALAAVATVSAAANVAHNGVDVDGKILDNRDRAPGHDHADSLLRHLVDRGAVDTDGIRHSAKVAWRALAMLQEELEAELMEHHDYVPPRAAVFPAPEKAPLPWPPAKE